ncbi:hypothetical protein [Brevundimonas lenta]|uniref:Uncharacterized protein n=1 Tax=Brevundimonas lenta TaxID=424796 RepID=A0A7W6JB25_9CAUL|nr:hypothetical protein [Brevundimonas lenta]MBB4081809.1 hypothetical protein [Brevundimonas lenta]
MTDTGLGEVEGGFGGGGLDFPLDEDEGTGSGARLIAFLRALDEDLRAMLADDAFLEDDRRAGALAAYESGPAGEIEAMITLLESDWDTVAPEVIRHGLTGLQADFKLGAQEEMRRIYRQGEIEPAAAAAEQYLAASDIILESLSSALGGAGAALIEFKKMIEWLKGLAAKGWRGLLGLR